MIFIIQFMLNKITTFGLLIALACCNLFTITKDFSPLTTPFTTTVDFNQTLDEIPQVAYGISCLSVLNQQLTITFNTTEITKSNVTFVVLASRTSVVIFCVNILINTENDVEIRTVNAINLPSIFPLKINFRSPRIFYFKMSTQLSTWNESCLTKQGILIDSSNCNIAGGSLTYIIMDELYFASKFAAKLPAPLDQSNIKISFSHFQSDESMIFSHVPFASTTWYTLTEHNIKDGENLYLFESCMEIGYIPGFSGNGVCTFLLFNPKYSCSSNKYFSSPSMNDIPTCEPCSSSCKTCTFSSDNVTLTSQKDCLSCSDDLTIFYNDDSMTRGQCLCQIGIPPPIGSPCPVCNYSCFTFSLRAITKPQGIIIMLSFSMDPLTFLKPLQDNLRLTFNNIEATKFDFQKKEGENYKITVSSSESVVEQCNVTCRISAEILDRRFVKYRSRILDKDQGVVYLEDVSFGTSETLRQLATATEGVITFAFLANAAKYVQVLFELEQLIEYHKYLNLTIPMNFMKLLIDMSGFEYVNIFEITNIDVYGVVGSVFGTDFDNQGDLRVIQQSRGNNFMKNMVECLGSFFILLLINYITYLAILMMPCGLCVDLKSHIEERKLNTINDNIEGIVMPIVFYSMQQFSNIVYQQKFVYLYLLVTLLWVGVLVYPLVIALTIYRRRKDEATKFHDQDLMMDCKLQEPFTYFLYICSFYRKVSYASFLAPQIPGPWQIFLILVLNSSFLLMLIYACCRKYHCSKTKIALKITFNTSIVVIDFCLFSFRKSFVMGQICKYFAFIAIFPMLFESLIKILEAAFNILRLIRQRQGEAKRVHPEGAQDMEEHPELDNHLPEFSGHIDQDDTSKKIEEESEGQSHMEEIYLDN